MGASPQRLCGGKRIEAVARPPGPFVTDVVELPVMGAAQRHGELVTDLAAECSRLGKAQVMWIGRATAADEAGLAGDELEMLPVAQAAWL